MHSDGVVNGDLHVFLENYYFFLIKPAFKKKNIETRLNVSLIKNITKNLSLCNFSKTDIFFPVTVTCCYFKIKTVDCRTGLHNKRPAGRKQSAKRFIAALETVSCDLKHLLSSPYLSYCDVVSNAIVGMRVKLERACYQQKM